jgi:hypothetical protein
MLFEIAHYTTTHTPTLAPVQIPLNLPLQRGEEIWAREIIDERKDIRPVSFDYAQDKHFDYTSIYFEYLSTSYFDKLSTGTQCKRSGQASGTPTRI